MPFLALDGTFDINSVPDPLSGAQVLRFLALPLLAYACVLLLRRAVLVARDPDCPPGGPWVFLGPAILCLLIWVLGVRAVLPDNAGNLHDVVAVLTGLATLAGLAAGAWWCTVTRDHNFETLPSAWKR